MSGRNTGRPVRGSFRGKPGRGRGNFRGKKDTRKYINGKEGKTEEIRRALTHRANLRKNYFKLLKKEGLDVPAKENEDVFDQQSQLLSDEEGNGNNISDTVKIQSNNDADSDHKGDEDDSEQDEEGKYEKNIDNSKVRNDNETFTTIDLIKQKVSNHEPLTFQERILLKKDRRMKDKERKMQKTREKLEYMKQQNIQRKVQTSRVKQAKTKKGQILMAPRIESLLEKIKHDKGL